jgi:hypothetical protein
MFSPCLVNFIAVLRDSLFECLDLFVRQPVICGQFDSGFNPEFGLAVGALHMDMGPILLA